MDPSAAHLSTAALFVAFDRARMDLGGGNPEIDCPNFIERFGHHLKHIAVGSALEELQARDEAEVVAVEDGHHVWSMT